MAGGIFVINRRADEARAPLPPKSMRLSAAGAIVLAAAAAFGMFARPASAQPMAARVTMLPFDALSDGPQARHFADALTDEIVTRLSSSRIRLVSRDAATTLRGSNRDAKVAQLGVALLFDGTVQDDGNAVMVRVHLDDPARHATLWSGSVNGPAANSDELQASIANTIVAVLACSSRALAPAHGLADPDLLSRYLHACDVFVNGLGSRDSLFEQLALLRDVAAKAPDFTPVHSDLARFAVTFSRSLPADQAAPLRQEGEAEAHKALALDPKSPDAYLALSQLLPPTDWAGREKLLRQGVAADPDWPLTNVFLGSTLAGTGRLRDAAGYFQKAAAVNLQNNWGPNNARLQCGSGQFEPATSYLSGALKTTAGTYGALRGCLSSARRWSDVRALVDPRATSVSLKAFADYDAYLIAEETGRPADVAKARSLAMAAPDGGNAAMVNAIEALSVLGFTDDAFAVANRYAPSGVMTAGDSAFLFFTLTAPLRRDPRFMQLAARIGLVDYWRSSGHWPDFCADPGLPYNCRTEADRLTAAK